MLVGAHGGIQLCLPRGPAHPAHPAGAAVGEPGSANTLIRGKRDGQHSDRIAHTAGRGAALKGWCESWKKHSVTTRWSHTSFRLATLAAPTCQKRSNSCPLRSSRAGHSGHQAHKCTRRVRTWPPPSCPSGQCALHSTKCRRRRRGWHVPAGRAQRQRCVAGFHHAPRQHDHQGPTMTLSVHSPGGGGGGGGAQHAPWLNSNRSALCSSGKKCNSSAHGAGRPASRLGHSTHHAVSPLAGSRQLRGIQLDIGCLVV